MKSRNLNILKLNFPSKRRFSWQLLWILAVLYLLGNLAGLPLLRKTGAMIEPIWFWGVVTLISVPLIALGLILANRTGIGAPFLEGRLSKAEVPFWIKSGSALTVLLCVAASPLSLLVNLGAERATYPFGWELLASSFKAGVIEEIGYRLLVVSLVVWLGSLIKRDREGRPTRINYWVAIILAGLIFGWAHVDARLGDPTTPFLVYTGIMLVNSFLGICFGWILWRMGLEWAIIAHFIFDAYLSLVLIPIYLSKKLLLWVAFDVLLIVAAIISWRYLHKARTEE